MNKKFLVLVLLVSSIFVFAQEGVETEVIEDEVVKSEVVKELYPWDAEDNISSLTRMTRMKQNVLDFNVSSPEDTKSAAIDFKIGFLLKNGFKLGIDGYFYNSQTENVNYENKSYRYDSSGIPISGDLAYWHTNKAKTWDFIKNSLDIYLGIPLKNDIFLHAMIGGGSNYDEYGKVYDRKELFYDSAGNLNIDSDRDFQISNSIVDGSSYVNLGFGFNLGDNFFKNDFVSMIAGFDKFNVILGGEGKANNLMVLNSTGLTTANFEGQGQSFNQKETYFISGTKDSVRNIIEHTEDFGFWGIENEAFVKAYIDFNKGIDSLKDYARFRFSPAFGFRFGTDIRKDNFDKKVIQYKSAYNGHIDEDSLIEQTDYDFLSDLNIGFYIPLTFEVRPTSDVQFKAYYTFDFDADVSKYTARYKQRHTQNGTTTSYVDPLITFSENSYTFNHMLKVRFRYEFEKIARLALGTAYNIEHYSSDNSVKAANNSRVNGDGTQGVAPYGSVLDATGYNKSDPTEAGSAGLFKQTIAPFLELDFKVKGDNSVITLGWKPTVNMVGSTLADTNLLNLANWQVKVVVKF